MKTRIFAYKNYIGIESSPDAEGILAKPGGTNMGVVVRADACEITPEAKEVFKNAGKEGGSFAPYMLTEHSSVAIPVHGKSSFAWMGSYLNASKVDEVKLGRDCSKSVLDDMIEVPDMKIPEGFKEIVDLSSKF